MPIVVGVLPPCKSDLEWRDRLIAAYREANPHRTNGELPTYESARRAVLNLQAHGLLPWSDPRAKEGATP